MIQLSRLPRCYARAEGDTSTGPKSSYRKVGTVRTLRTITGGPLRRLEDLAAGLRRRLSGAPLATKHANLAGCLLVQSTEGRPPNRNAAFSRAGSGYGGAASAGAFGFPGDRRFSVGSGTLSTRYGCPCFSRLLSRRSAEIVRMSGSTATSMSRSGSTSSFSESGVDQIAATARPRKAVGHFRSLRPFDPCLTHAGAGR